MAKKEKKVLNVENEELNSEENTPETVKKGPGLVEPEAEPAKIPKGFYIQLTLSGEYVVCKEGKVMSKPMSQAKAEDTARRFNR